MQPLVYHCPEAPPSKRYVAHFLSAGNVLPLTTYAATREDALTGAKNFLERERAGPVAAARKPAAKPLPSVQSPKAPVAAAANTFEDLL